MDVFIAPLRIANEAFMVASTIERCPRQMMLRELVMNALEAASGAEDAPKQVRIDTVEIDGAPKLRIWNTGRGLSQAELLQISDLSSSLFKTVSLDGNFGMGAKAASLSSNKHGLRYRSCRLGKVSQIVLGARGGVYGRMLQDDPVTGERREAIDVTLSAVAAGEDLSHDWTEVTLFGNSASQDTAADPYAGDPVLPRDWALQTLGRRFVGLPEGVELAIEPSASGAATRQIFTPALTPSSFDRFEAVSVEGGVVIHYGYRAKNSALAVPSVPVVGVGAVVYDGEVYALTNDQRWALEAPTYGFTFAAKQCSVIIELPHSFAARPEQYRQFLRFIDGDQHQLQFADFGDLVRRNLPPWLRRIIASLLPAQSDYLAEIRDEMRHLMADLGIEDLLGAPHKPKPEEGGTKTPAEARDPPKSSDAPKSPEPLEAPSPPEVILVENEADIVEKALGGRAARFYPAARQVFVNARYAAFARMQAQLDDEFAAFADEETIKRLSKLTSEWAIIQRIARTLLHSIGKPKVGWSADEIRTAQSPESMSLMVDDIGPLLGPARRRMAAQLGLEGEPNSGGVGLGGDPSAARAAGELADAEARLQRAMAGNAPSLAPFYRQVGAIHLRQRNVEEARAWLKKGMAVDASDAWCRHDYVGLLLDENDYDGAVRVADEALSVATGDLSPFHRRRAEVEFRRGDLRRAEAMLRELATNDQQTPWAYFDLVGVYMAEENFEAAVAAADAAIKRSPGPSAQFLRRRGEIDMRRGDLGSAGELFKQALALDSRDHWARLFLAKVYAEQRRYDEAVRELDAALMMRPPQEDAFHRARSDLELQRGQPAAALAAAQRAVRVEPTEVWSHLALARTLLAINDLDGATDAAADAARFASSAPPGKASAYLPSVYRQQAEIEARRGRPATALSLLERALAIKPKDGWTWFSISTHRIALNDLAAAEAAAAAAAAAFPSSERVHALRRRAEIAAKRNDGEAAEALLREAMEIAPTDPWSRLQAADQLLVKGDAEGAAVKAKEAIAVSPAPTSAMLMRVARFEERRGHLDSARGYLQQAMATDPGDPQPWSVLANVLLAAGDLTGAREAAEKAASIAAQSREPMAAVAAG